MYIHTYTHLHIYIHTYVARAAGERRRRTLSNPHLRLIKTPPNFKQDLFSCSHNKTLLIRHYNIIVYILCLD